jgi:VCBS repeat-containing protein
VSINNPPVVVNDEFTALKGTPLTIPAPGVLSNDTDLEGNDLTAQLVNEPSNGTLSLETDGSFTYTPDAGFSGVDIFTYTASDGEFGSVEATVTITVINRPPTVNDRSYNVAPDIALNVAPPGILAGANDPDGDPLTAQLVRGPRHGVLTVNPNGSFTYTPLSGYVGADDFIFRVSDGNLSSNPATVRLTIGNEGTVRVRQYLAFLGR